MSSPLLKITVQVVANSKSVGIEMISETVYKVRTSAPAIDDRANAWVTKQLAQYFKVPITHVVLDKGEKTSKKTFLIIEK